MVIKNNLYIIIPLYSILCWALYFAVFINPYLNTVSYDFTNLYYCGGKVLNEPWDLYDLNEIQPIGVKYGYKYFPNFAVIIGVPLYLISSIFLAYKIFYIINIILAMIFLLLFNQILILLNLKKKILRFIFLFIISNGYLILDQFRNNQLKFFLGVIILFILKQEIQFRITPFDKDFKFYLKTYNLFILIIGTFPYFLFFFLIYLFQDIPKKELFKKDNLKKYLIIIISFIAQNFLFILYPKLIREYYIFVQVENKRFNSQLSHFYLKFIEDYGIFIPKDTLFYITNMLNIILYIIVILLTIIRKLKIEEKFGLLSVSIIFLNYVGYRIAIILLPLTSLLFIPFLNQQIRGIEFIKRNKAFIIGLICISCIYIIPIKNVSYYPSIEGHTIFHFILVILLGICIIFLYKKNHLSEKEDLKKVDFMEKKDLSRK